MRYFRYFIFFIGFISCKPEYTAQEIIDKAIQNAGLDVFDKSELTFGFRKDTYTAVRNEGSYQYHRIIPTDSVVIKDVLSNEGFQRFFGENKVELSEKKVNQLSNKVNSVHYFSVLPYGLNDKAVKKKLVNTVKIKGDDFYKIEITFNENGGGDDHDDVFLYWFRKETFLLEYLAYKYHTDGGGIRFRDIKKEHNINGIRFLDYKNFKLKTKDIDFYAIDSLYEEGELIHVSDIELENIKIKSPKNN